MATAHPLETLFVALVAVLVLSWAFGFTAGIAFFGVFFVGFTAALLFVGGAFFLQQGKIAWGVAMFIAAFVLLGLIGAGVVKF